MFRNHYAPNKCEPIREGRCQGECELRIEVLLKMQRSWGGVLEWGGGGQDGCKPRIEVIMKMWKKVFGGEGVSGSGGCSNCTYAKKLSGGRLVRGRRVGQG